MSVPYNLKDPEAVKEYLKNLYIEYKFGCYSEKNPEACHLLGDYEESIKKDNEEAAKVYKMNCDTLNYGKSCSKYGDFRLVGRGCDKNITEAYKYMKKGCELNDAKGCYHAGVVAATTEVLEKDRAVQVADGVRMLQKACDGNEEKACFHLSGIFIAGIKGYVEKDFSRSYKLAMKSCDFGNPYACANLSVMHRNGDGVEKSEEMADSFKDKAMKLLDELQNNKRQLKFHQGIESYRLDTMYLMTVANGVKLIKIISAALPSIFFQRKWNRVDTLLKTTTTVILQQWCTFTLRIEKCPSYNRLKLIYEKVKLICIRLNLNTRFDSSWGLRFDDFVLIDRRRALNAIKDVLFGPDRTALKNSRKAGLGSKDFNILRYYRIICSLSGPQGEKPVDLRSTKKLDRGGNTGCMAVNLKRRSLHHSTTVIMRCHLFVFCSAFLVISIFVQQKPVSADEASNKVIDVDVYYESLCPDSKQWIRVQLAESYYILKDYIRLNLIPYGKANQLIDSATGQWVFSCQHGPDECDGNKAQACAIHAIKNEEPADKVQELTKSVVVCAMSTRFPPTEVEKCAEKLWASQKTQDAIKACMAGPLSSELLAENGKKTAALSPPISFVPTIVINGVYSKENQNKAYNNFLKLICDNLQGTKPSECSSA
ncbi:uncharacterized protein LOC143215601 [Lasioglossum baleicum]|uniref:uncharacterized protein LOC143215601 n=1 Tax=Lasioglossum baleicum TaxID=434251 RepID=UPI003FCCECCB